MSSDEINTLLKALLDAIEHSILPLSTGDQPEVFGAAVLSRSTLRPLTVATNHSDKSPISHGELNCIQRFHTVSFPDADSRPRPRECIVVSSHEPCSMCLSAIAWTRIPQVYYLFSYGETEETFGMADDIEIIEQLFPQAQMARGTGSESARLYDRDNAYFQCQSLAMAVERLSDPQQRDKWTREIERIKKLYIEQFVEP